MARFKQTTLFGSLANDQDEHIYKHPANTYEKFEMWWQVSKKSAASNKQEAVKEAQVSKL